MNKENLRNLLLKVREGNTSIDDALSEITYSSMQIEDIGFATLDHNRKLRLGLGEVIYGEGKNANQIVGIAKKFSVDDGPVLITRLNDEKIKVLKNAFPNGRINSISGTFTIHPLPYKEDRFNDHYIAIVTAGTSDNHIAEEAVEVCAAMGVAFTRVYDIGVSGIQRLLNKIKLLNGAATVIVIAGMEGALPSVIGGLIDPPIIAVPTDVGYGANFQGLSALLSMLSSCAPGLTVTNINGGFSAAFAACRIVRTLKRNSNQ